MSKELDDKLKAIMEKYCTESYNLEERGIKCYSNCLQDALAEIKAAFIAELPEPLAPIIDRYPMNTTAQISRELSEARISKHNELIKDIIEKFK